LVSITALTATFFFSDLFGNNLPLGHPGIRDGKIPDLYLYAQSNGLLDLGYFLGLNLLDSLSMGMSAIAEYEVVKMGGSEVKTLMKK